MEKGYFTITLNAARGWRGEFLRERTVRVVFLTTAAADCYISVLESSTVKYSHTI